MYRVNKKIFLTDRNRANDTNYILHSPSFGSVSVSAWSALSSYTPELQTKYFQQCGTLVIGETRNKAEKRFVCIKDGFFLVYFKRVVPGSGYSRRQLEIYDYYSAFVRPVVVFPIRGCMFDISTQIRGGRGFEVINPAKQTFVFQTSSKEEAGRWIEFLNVGRSITLSSGVRAQKKVKRKQDELRLLEEEKDELEKDLERIESKKNKAQMKFEEVVEKDNKLKSLKRVERAMGLISFKVELELSAREAEELHSAFDVLKRYL
eukprot:snap_masked-scaffold_1-processed-gene-27.14-mRNA-1 protein AED:1.00 eAED:1.00 QI:0/-1/0/0/-1/1/1/0/261